MKRRALASLLSLSVASIFAAETPASKPGTFCWKMHFAGVVPGISIDANVVRLLGPGAHRPNEGEGVRYYVDQNRTATMRVATFTDRVVGEISVARGVANTLTTQEQRLAASAQFQGQEQFGNWHALSLGSTQDEVLKNLGPPARKEGDAAWVYDAECTCELPEYMTLHFQAGKVVRVVFSAPPG